LPWLLPKRRWFVSKAKTIRATHVLARLPIGPQKAIFLINVEFAEGEPEIYALPLVILSQTAAAADETAFLHVVDVAGKHWTVGDGLRDVEFARLLLQIAVEEREVDGAGLRLVGRLIGDGAAPRHSAFPSPGTPGVGQGGGQLLKGTGGIGDCKLQIVNCKLEEVEGHGSPSAAPRLDLSTLIGKLPETEQSNSNVVFGDQLIFKLYRKLGEGINPELEVGEHLTAKSQFANCAPLVAAIELHGVRGSSMPQTLAVVLTFVPNQGDAWHNFVDHGQRYFEALGALTPEQMSALCMPGEAGCAGDGAEIPQPVQSIIGAPLGLARLLGQRTAEMHAALADDHLDPSFAPEPYSANYQRSLFQSMRNTTRNTMHSLSQRLSTLTGEAGEMGQWVLQHEAEVLAMFRTLSSLPTGVPRIRVHGDYHLGQVLWTGKDFIIIDFEGEPLRSVGERRLKRSPMRDVAGMVRSFDYAAWTALRKHRKLFPAETVSSERDATGAVLWAGWLSREFVRSYTTRLRELRPDLVWPNVADTKLVLRCWVLEKALYEVSYELNARPDWVDIPLRAIMDLLKDQKP
jgi:maltose alpha-D-glucosyltransferase/alpha-amylase